jgi:CDGSH-type Zn-finger protein
MSEPKVAQKGPYVLEAKKGTYHWCACGHSQKQPFCDGSHKAFGMKPMLVEVKEDGPKPWCGCKHTKTPPYCDGTHTKL